MCLMVGKKLHPSINDIASNMNDPLSGGPQFPCESRRGDGQMGRVHVDEFPRPSQVKDSPEEIKRSKLTLLLHI